MSDLYTKLFHDILTSSIWSEDDKTRIMWVTVLALCDNHGFVSGSIPGLATMARMSVKDAETVLDKLQSPDKYSRTEDHEGRRIEKVDGGWFVLNYGKYRERGKAEIRKEQGRVRQSRYRDSLKSNAKVTHSNASVTESNDPAISIPYKLSSKRKEEGVGEGKQSYKDKPFTKWTDEEFKQSIRDANEDDLLTQEELGQFFNHWTQKDASGKDGYKKQDTWSTRHRMRTSYSMIYAKNRPKPENHI